MLTVKKANKITGGGISNRNKKMPGYTYGLSAKKCITGGKLQAVPGSVCFNCYALKANYFYPSVKKGHALRLRSLNNKGWVDAMIFLINRYEKHYFRWHDSGDIQSVNHLKKICDVASGRLMRILQRFIRQALNQSGNLATHHTRAGAA